jgi:hypothetical protein
MKILVPHIPPEVEVQRLERRREIALERLAEVQKRLRERGQSLPWPFPFPPPKSL